MYPHVEMNAKPYLKVTVIGKNFLATLNPQHLDTMPAFTHIARIHAYCLMDNHYHLLMETPSGNLSQIMRHINGGYTTYFNVKRDRSGHLFQGRYKAILVEIDEYAKELSRYIHLNPIRAKMVQTKEIGLQFGIGESGVSQSCRRVSQQMEKDKKLKKKIYGLEKQIYMSRMKT